MSKLKLYYSKGTCSLASMIVFEELELPYEAIDADFDFSTPQGKAFHQANPLGVVPTLVLENGEALTEGVAILQYLADHKPEKNLAPLPNSFERLRLQELLNFIATEVHKGYGPLFSIDAMVSDPKAREELRSYFVEKLQLRYDILDHRLRKHEFLMGPHFTVADAYLYNITTWASFLKVDLSRFEAVTSYMTKLRSRPSIVRAFQAERKKP